jgi:hypothetical protein
MQYIVQPVLEKGANHPTFSVNYSGKTYALANVRSRLVLQADGAALGQASWSEGTSGQRWKLQRLADGRYKICCASVTSYCLDASTPTEVKVANSSDSEAQKWELVPMGGAVYHIRSSTAGKALAESGGRFVLADEYLPVDDSAEEAQKNPEQKFVLAEIQANALAETYGKAISIHTDIEHRGEQRSVALGKYDNGVPEERVWRMRNLGSGNYLGLNNEGGGRQDAAQAVGWLATQWRQIFRIEPVPGTSHYRILEVETGLVLAVGTTTPPRGPTSRGFRRARTRWGTGGRSGHVRVVS